jgi:hypothetical protein
VWKLTIELTETSFAKCRIGARGGAGTTDCADENTARNNRENNKPRRIFMIANLRELLGSTKQITTLRVAGQVEYGCPARSKIITLAKLTENSA